MVLPEPLEQCRLPVAFSPSELTFGDQCLLRSVLASAREVAALTTHPAARLGNVFHRLLELAARGEIDRSGSPSEDAERTLNALLDDEDARLAAEWPVDSPRLRKVYPPLTWRRKRRVVLNLAEKYLSGAVPMVATRSRRKPLRAKDLPPNGVWAEVEIEATSLRLRGRIDVIERNDGDAVIRDLKTGRVLTTEGEMLPHIERQLRLYGAMAHVVWPSARVSLIVDDGVERSVEFTREHETELLSWLRRVLDELPPESDVPTQSLARPGEACDGCPHRHVCPAYLREAPEYWRKESAVRMPLDIWGEVIAVKRRDTGCCDVTIRDAAGRIVKVFGLAAFRCANLEPKRQVWFFGLRTWDKRGGPEVWRHPYNFFEVADDDPFARAWTLESFVASP